MKFRKPEYGDIRLKKTFLWFPKKLRMSHSNRYMTRWLERATIVQKCHNSYFGWEDLRWEDE